MRKLVLVVLGAAVMAGHLSAAAVTIFGDRADTQVHKFGIINGDPGQNQGQNGLNGSLDYSMVYVFQLPVLGANQTITAADFSPYVLSAGLNNPTDLYGLSYRVLSTVLASDWYTGTGDPNNTLIQSSFLTQNFSFNGRTSTSPAGDAALLNYIKAQYASGAVGGDYIFLRLSTNGTTLLNGSVNFYYTADVTFFLASATGQPLSRFQNEFGPRLELTVEDTAVPEPASVVMVAIGVGVAVLVRSRRARAL